MRGAETGTEEERLAGEQIHDERPREEQEDDVSSGRRLLCAVYDFFEVFGVMTAAVRLVFAFVVRLNAVDGSSMQKTLADGDYLAVSSLPYEPARGDIVIIHKIDADPYDLPIVKRVVAVGGETVDIDFDTWTLTVDGEAVEESYRWLNPKRELLKCEYPLPVTLGENEIFVMGDNRNGSADSRQEEIGPVDRRCVAGRALARLSPTFAIFENPFGSDKS